MACKRLEKGKKAFESSRKEKRSTLCLPEKQKRHMVGEECTKRKTLVGPEDKKCRVFCGTSGAHRFSQESEELLATVALGYQIGSRTDAPGGIGRDRGGTHIEVKKNKEKKDQELPATDRNLVGGWGS